jgi:hypothetical protein
MGSGGPETKDEKITERNLVRHMVRFRENPFDFLREVSLYMSGTGWRAYDEPIGQPIFYSGFSERTNGFSRNRTMWRTRLRSVIFSSLVSGPPVKPDG